MGNFHRDDDVENWGPSRLVADVDFLADLIGFFRLSHEEARTGSEGDEAHFSLSGENESITRALRR